MRLVATLFTAAVFFSLSLLDLGAHHGPEKLVFKARNGDVTFSHEAHVKRAKGDCKTCHDKLFPQSSTAPLNYKAGVHKVAEAKKISCGACHFKGGPAFASQGSCAKCHVKG